jgi:uncharacterized repeat protein (TIGR03803 family)
MQRQRIARPHKISHIMCAVLVMLAGLNLIPRARASETVLHSFTGSDGSQPTAGLTPDGAGNYYGTTLVGGIFGFGTIFELSPGSGGGWTETVLYNFTGTADGSQPTSSVVLDSSGNLYGSTEFGGTYCAPYGCGVTFKLSKSGGQWKETVLYTFTGGIDGGFPNGVVLGAQGNIYGSAGTGGSLGNGVVFEVSRNSGGGWTQSVIYNFTGGAVGGRAPNGTLTFDSFGRLYGTTDYSGTTGGGIVFRLTRSKTGVWTESLLHSFTLLNGSNPNGGLVLDSAGNIYGTAQAGGNTAGCDGFGCGLVFKLSPKAGGEWEETVLYEFTRGTDGGYPQDGLVMDASGNLYGTTYGGGNPNFCGSQNGCGVVFELSPGTSGYTETVMHEFIDSDGAFSGAPLTRDSSGNLFGTTFNGGNLSDCGGVGCGVVFEVTP